MRPRFVSCQLSSQSIKLVTPASKRQLWGGQDAAKAKLIASLPISLRQPANLSTFLSWMTSLASALNQAPLVLARQSAPRGRAPRHTTGIGRFARRVSMRYLRDIFLVGGIHDRPHDIERVA